MTRTLERGTEPTISVGLVDGAEAADLGGVAVVAYLSEAGAGVGCEAGGAACSGPGELK